MYMFVYNLHYICLYYDSVIIFKDFKLNVNIKTCKINKNR